MRPVFSAFGQVFSHLGSEFVKQGGEASLGKSSMMSIEEVSEPGEVETLRRCRNPGNWTLGCTCAIQYHVFLVLDYQPLSS